MYLISLQLCRRHSALSELKICSSFSLVLCNWQLPKDVAVCCTLCSAPRSRVALYVYPKFMLKYFLRYWHALQRTNSWLHLEVPGSKSVVYLATLNTAACTRTILRIRCYINMPVRSLLAHAYSLFIGLKWTPSTHHAR